MRLLRLAAASVLIVVLGVGAWAAIYAYDKGFTKKWRQAIMAEFERRGIEADIGKLTIDPVEGLVARNVRIFADEDHTSVLASINNITLDIDIAKMLRKQQFLNTVEFRDADISLPIDPDDPDSERLELKDFSARIQIPENMIEIERAECLFHGIRVTLAGSLLQPKPKPATEGGGLEKQMDLLKARRTMIAAAVEEIERFRLDPAAPPQLRIEVIGDLEHPETIEATAHLSGKGIGRGSFIAESLELRAEWRHPDILIDQVKITDEFGELHADARWRAGDEKVVFNVESSIDSHALLRSFFDAPALADVVFYEEKPRLSAEGVYFLSPEAAGGPVQLRMIGSIECGNFGTRGGSIFEGAYADFSIDPARWYVRNLRLDHKSGQATGEALYDSAEGIRYRAAVEMDPTVFTSFLQAPQNERLIDRFRFDSNPTISLRFAGSGPDLDTNRWSTTGRFTLGPCHYNEIPVLGASGQFETGGGSTTFREFRIDREEGHIDGDFVQVRDTDGLVVVKNVRGRAHPALVAAYFAPKTARALAHYQFLNAPNLTLDGTIDARRGGDRTQLVANFSSQGPASLDLFRRELVLTNPVGSVSVNGHELSLKLRAGLFGGEADYEGSFGLGPKAGNYAGALDARTVNFGQLAEHYQIPTSTRGTLDGKLSFIVPASDPRRWSGRGEAQLTDGDVFAIPVMGPVSRLVSGVMDRPKAGYSVATDAQASFTIESGVIMSEDFVAYTPGFILRARGSIDPIEDQLDIDAEMNARGALRLVGWPLAKLLRYKGEGSLSDPQWRPVNFTLPQRREGDETILPAGRVTDLVPRAVGEGAAGAVEVGTKALGTGAKVGSAALGTGASLTKEVGSKALGTGAKVTREVGSAAIGTGAKVIGTGTKGAVELGSKARDLVPLPRMFRPRKPTPPTPEDSPPPPPPPTPPAGAQNER